MESIIRHTCREIESLFISVYSDLFQPFLGIFTLLNTLPAFLYGCDAPQALPSDAETVTKLTVANDASKINELDIFVFRDDRLQRLDSYQKVEDPPMWNHEVISSSGERLITVFANSRKESNDWAAVTSLAYIRDLSVCIEDEDPTCPFMSGLAGSRNGSGNDTRIFLSPLFSTVELRSIRCDFTGRPYAGERLEDVKVYLTNVNAECRILDTSGIFPSRIINAGKLQEEDMLKMQLPDIIFREIGEDIGRNAVYPDIRLICYPNNSQVEGPGTPFTRLVIEGRIGGETFYWPLDINRDGEGYGIGRNERYVFDLKITRKGTKDPDMPVKSEDMDIIFNIEKWMEKEEYEVSF